MAPLVEIGFHKSRSKNFGRVIAAAKVFDSFTEGEVNTLKINDISELFGRWDNFSLVIFAVTKWTGTNVYYNGRPVLPYSNDFFYKFLTIRLCYSEYMKREDKPAFCCQRGWGCNRMEGVTRWITSDFTGKPFWYEYGHFSGDGVWKVDKKRILNVLMEEAKIKMVDQCPAFSRDVIADVVAGLPDVLHVNNENWEIVYRTDFREDGPVRFPVGIMHIDLEDPPLIDPPGSLPENDKSEIDNSEANRLIDAWKFKQNKGPWEEEPF